MLNKSPNQAKRIATYALKIASKRSIQKRSIAELTGDFICNKIADKTTQKSQELHHRLACKQLILSDTHFFEH